MTRLAVKKTDLTSCMMHVILINEMMGVMQWRSHERPRFATASSTIHALRPIPSLEVAGVERCGSQGVENDRRAFDHEAYENWR